MSKLNKNEKEVKKINQYKTIASNLGFPLTKCSNIDILENGDEIFKSMLSSIKSAKDYILFETFVYWNGDIAKKFTDALCEKAKSGVTCKVLLDGYGSNKIADRYKKNLIDCGVELVFYNPITYKNFLNFKKNNRRTHRKIVVIDGHLAFIGGVGIADKWNGNASNEDEFRDLHFKLQGKVVSDLQAAFFDNWLEYSTKETKIQNYVGNIINPTVVESELDCNLILSSPLIKHNTIEEMLVYGVTFAKDTIKIITPYFIPSEKLLKSFETCIKNGATVEVILSAKHIDEKAALYCSRYYWKKYLELGINIYLYQPTFNHAKVMIIDKYWCSVGSLNMDIRSLKINEEANLNIFSPDFANKIDKVFIKDKKCSNRLDKTYFKNLSFVDKIKDFLYSFLSNLL